MLKLQENFNMLSLQQTVRLLKVFSYSQHINLNKHRIIEKLVRSIESKMDELEENDVINLLNAYVYLEGDVPKSSVLFNKINTVVSNQAL